MKSLSKPLQDLRRERDELARQLRLLDNAISILHGSGGGIGRRGAGGAGAKRRLSPAARRRIAQAQKTRWAKWRAQKRKSG